MFWSSVSIIFEQQLGTSVNKRTAESLCSRWGTLQRQVQKFLAAERAYHSKPVSGETSQDAADNVMRLYCSRNKKVDNNGFWKDGPPLRSLAAVNILRDCPKFSGIDNSARLFSHVHNSVEFEVATEVDDDVKIGACTTSSRKTTVPKQSPGRNQPRGVKASKSIAKSTSGDHSGRQSLANAMIAKTEVKKQELQLRCISELPDGDAKTELLMKFLATSISEGGFNEKEKYDGGNSIPEEDKPSQTKSKISVVDLMNDNKEV